MNENARKPHLLEREIQLWWQKWIPGHKDVNFSRKLEGKLSLNLFLTSAMEDGNGNEKHLLCRLLCQEPYHVLNNIPEEQVKTTTSVVWPTKNIFQLEAEVYFTTATYWLLYLSRSQWTDDRTRENISHLLLCDVKNSVPDVVCGHFPVSVY